jgi:hypothetical protein
MLRKTRDDAAILKLRYGLAMLCFILIFSFSSKSMAQSFFPYNPYPALWTTSPWYVPPLPVYAPVLPSPLLAPPAPVPVTRYPAATIIITNPTAGTATVNTVAPAPATTTSLIGTYTPLVSTLATLYTSALYNSPLSVANPLLFAVLSNLFI